MSKDFVRLELQTAYYKSYFNFYRTEKDYAQAFENVLEHLFQPHLSTDITSCRIMDDLETYHNPLRTINKIIDNFLIDVNAYQS